jgi:stage II sporulation protein M
MNKLLNNVRYEVIREKRLYLFLTIMLFMGVISGSIFLTVLKEADKLSVTNHLVAFFTEIKNNNIQYSLAFKNSVSSNLLFIILIWLLGISVIGIPIIIFIVFIKGFIIGFSVGAIILQYKIIGLLGALAYIFPHIIISSFIILILSCYALYLSFNIFWSIVQRKNMNFKNIINRYSFIMLISIIGMILASFFEVFLSPYFIKFFLLFTK